MLEPIRKAKLRWRCRRGMLELDLIFQRFIDSYLDQLNETEIRDFESLLTYPDPDLFSWLMGNAMPENKELDHIIELIQLHSGVR
ncbi:MAG: hypothetical protein A3F46_05595 [Legionellales bacterium RIFCSPHIGHO2_12_FULL_42_9]|nr:MAG: hypothetical protein A3F46_05595 [Legionellales bacterium RIFCSPHIGHO2_12_FULL_42_9]